MTTNSNRTSRETSLASAADINSSLLTWRELRRAIITEQIRLASITAHNRFKLSAGKCLRVKVSPSIDIPDSGLKLIAGSLVSRLHKRGYYATWLERDGHFYVFFATRKQRGLMRLAFGRLPMSGSSKLGYWAAAGVFLGAFLALLGDSIAIFGVLPLFAGIAAWLFWLIRENLRDRMFSVAE